MEVNATLICLVTPRVEFFKGYSYNTILLRTIRVGGTYYYFKYFFFLTDRLEISGRNNGFAVVIRAQWNHLFQPLLEISG